VGFTVIIPITAFIFMLISTRAAFIFPAIRKGYADTEKTDKS
jgi:hypothetical protein